MRTERVEIRQANELDIKKETKMVGKRTVVIWDMKRTPTLYLFGFHMKENRVLMKCNNCLEIQFEKIFLKGWLYLLNQDQENWPVSVHKTMSSQAKKKKPKQSKNKQTDKKTVIFKGLKIWLASNFYAAVISPLR